MSEWMDCASTAALMGVGVVGWLGFALCGVMWAGNEWSAWRLKRTSARLIREHDAMWSDFNDKLRERVSVLPPSAAGQGGPKRMGE